jgi:hypothetical protein
MVRWNQGRGLNQIKGVEPMKTLSEINTKFMSDERKLDFYGTIGRDCRPHITVLNSLLKLDDTTLVWGQFCTGLSKMNQVQNPQVGFMLLTPDLEILRGKAEWFESKTAGTEFEMYNSIPRYRYNSYFGYSPIHYLRIVSLKEQQKMDTMHYENAKAISEKAAILIYQGSTPEAVSRFTKSYFASPKSFKVISYVDKDGYPKLLPLNQGVLTEGGRVVFSMGQEFGCMEIPEGIVVAIYAITLDKRFSVLLKGTLNWKDTAEGRVGLVDIDQVYNPMMPKPGYIYPRPILERTVYFEDVLYEYNV